MTEDLANAIRRGHLDLLTALAMKNQEHPFQEIFKHLSGQSILNAKLTCKTWHAKVHEYVYESLEGRRNMFKRFEENLRNDISSEKSIRIKAFDKIADVKIVESNTTSER